MQLATRESRSLSSQIIKTLLVVLKPLNAILDASSINMSRDVDTVIKLRVWFFTAE